MPPTAVQPGAPARYPRIPRLTKERRQQAQVDYLVWRLDMYLKDYGALRSDRKRWMSMLAEVRKRSGYEDVLATIEAIISEHLTKQLNQIQSIYNERTD